MTRTMNSQALALMDRILGLSGSSAGEQYTTLDDGNVQQVIDISAIARRSLTPAGSLGLYSIRLRNFHSSSALKIDNPCDPYNFANELTISYDTNAWPVPVPRGFDVWLIGASAWSDSTSKLAMMQLNLTLPSGSMAINQTSTDNSLAQVGNDIAVQQLVRWSTVLGYDVGKVVSDMFTWLDAAGNSYQSFNTRLVQGTTLNFISIASSTTVKATCELLVGIFPEGLGQDIAT